MQFEELIQSVFVNTNRPELLAETKLAIRRATTKMHNLDYFLADLSEGSMAIDNSLKARIDVAKFGPHYRKLASLSALDTDGSLRLLPKIEPAIYAGNKGSAGYYELGGTLVIQNCGLLNKLQFQFYTLPLTAENNYDSWIASKHPYAIIDEASKTVLASVGNTERANFFAGLVGNKLPRPSGHIAEILSSNAIGYDSAE